MSYFSFLSPDELTRMQAEADRQQWEIECRSLGATNDAIKEYDDRAWAYAMTTLWPNSEIVATARRAARDALARGESFPLDIEQAVRMQYIRGLARSLEKL